FPVWLSPGQVIVMPITDAQLDYANLIVDQVKSAGLRVKLDSRNEKINRKIRDAEELKIPYMLIVGRNEMDNETVSIRKHGKGDLGVVTVDTIVSRIKKENDEKANE
ncbi:MAG: threonine--tRNA ligase, partial [Candidatus Latescibacteria bacterium]|nr:threonine--tRNA ligase [Candidatus Latescibacterota bacterium]